MMRIYVAMLCAFASIPMTVDAQSTRSATQGFFAGLALHGSAIEIEDLDDERESGGGLRLKLGYGFTRLFARYLEGSAASLRTDEDENWTLAHFDLGGRFSLGSQGSVVVPYLLAALSARAGTQEDVLIQGSTTPRDLEISGAGFTAGGGLLIFFHPSWAFDADLKFTAGEFSKIRYGNVSVDGLEIDATSTRFNVGVSWHPGGRR
jgi:hypothetical protein